MGLDRFAAEQYPLVELSDRIIGGFYEVYNTFGFGFLESVYKRALEVELTDRGLTVAREVPFDLTYRGVAVGRYRADLIIDGSIIVEVKSGHQLDRASQAQVINYLSASRIPVGLLLLFGPRPEVRRFALTRKKERR